MEQYKVISIAAILANKAFSYSVTTIDNIVPFITNQDPFIYNTTTSTSCYTVDNFVGIIINIKASKQFTAGYGQFLIFKRLNTGV